MRLPMNNRRRTLGVLAIAVILVLGIAWFLVGPGEAPAGQSPLVTLEAASLEALRADFNRDSDHARMIVLLSPT
jgi:hypothetical protein